MDEIEQMKLFAATRQMIADEPTTKLVDILSNIVTMIGDLNDRVLELQGVDEQEEEGEDD